MHKKRFVYFIFINILLLFIGYIILFYYQIGAKPPRSNASFWVDHMYDIKDSKAKSIDVPKIIIISGSNSLFGINSQIISEITAKPTLNLGLHAALDINFLYYKIKKYINEGDIVVMPLEYGYYNRKGYSKWFISNILMWGYGYYYDLSLFDKINFIWKANPGRVLKGVKAKFEMNMYKKEDNAAIKLKKLIATHGEQWRGYSYKSLNVDGDINADEFNIAKNIGAYINYSAEPSEHFLDTYTKIKKLVDDNNGKLYLVPPVTFRNPKFDLSNIQHINKLNAYSKKLKTNYGINIRCNPILFNIDEKYAFNTNSHPNKYGALIRSENLAQCINRLVSNDNVSNISNDEAVETLKLLENKYKNVVKTKPIPN